MCLLEYITLTLSYRFFLILYIRKCFYFCFNMSSKDDDDDEDYRCRKIIHIFSFSSFSFTISNIVILQYFFMICLLSSVETCVNIVKIIRIFRHSSDSVKVVTYVEWKVFIDYFQLCKLNSLERRKMCLVR